MSKAEDRAIEKYPVEMHEVVGWRCVDKNAYKRQYFVEGYHQAEKDMELTWEDVRRIYLIVNSTINDVGMDNLTDKSIYQEVLKRFKTYKEE